MNRLVAPWVLGALPLLLLLPACRGGSSDDVAAGPVDAGPPPPPYDLDDEVLDVVRLQTRGAAGEEEELQGPLPELPVPVPAETVLRLETWQRLADFRVRLVDEHDRLVAYQLQAGPVASRSEARPEPGGTWLAVTPKEPLEPGETYYLKIEGERDERVSDVSGRTYDDLVITLEPIAPEPEAPPEATEAPAE